MNEPELTLNPEIATPRAAANTSLRPAVEWTIAAALCLIGLFVRIWRIDAIPPGLWMDEAINGLDAFHVLTSGKWPIFFQHEVYPREPLYIYLIVPWVKLLGATPQAIRLTSVMIGALTLPIAYLFFREWFGWRTALTALACLVFLRWHVHFSRTGFRTILSPPFLLLGFYFLHRGLRLERMREYIFAGVAFGLGFYTYLSFRLAPLVGIIWLGGYVALNRKALPQGFGKGLAAMFAAALLTFTPLGVHYLRVPYHFTGRADMVSVFGGDNDRTLGMNLIQTALNARDVALMFGVRGDGVAKHNVPARYAPRTDGVQVEKPPMPVFDPLTSIVFYCGLMALFIQLCRWRRDVAAAHAALLMLAWLGVMSLNSILSNDPPNLLRTVIMTPAVALTLAMGFLAIYDLLAQRFSRKWILSALLALVFLGYAGNQMWAYFSLYPRCLRIWDFNSDRWQIGQLAARESEFFEVHMPSDWLYHPTVEYALLSAKGEAHELKLPESLMAPEADDQPLNPKPRYLIYTDWTGIRRDIHQLFPRAREAAHMDEYRKPYAYSIQLIYPELKPQTARDALTQRFKDRLGKAVYPER
ncbi:glycosyltransferase family 39 protein [Candidatus Sumerlaeota bacterium]|nr:glycosyltransferase family 39 protein [Candidatus Sumerlaeota bacterium]